VEREGACRGERREQVYRGKEGAGIEWKGGSR
jgi:hypothetical protein